MVYIWETSFSSDVSQNFSGQLDCRLFKSAMLLEQNDEILIRHVVTDLRKLKVEIKFQDSKNDCISQGN